MGLLDMFRRPAPIRDAVALADFIDQQAAFLVQKGMYEYSRARAGPYAKSMLTEPAFVAAVNGARWRAYPLGLAMVGEMIAGVLRTGRGTDDGDARAALAALVLSVFDRYPVPAPVGDAAWQEARRELALRLDRIGLHPPKPVKDIPVPFAEGYFALMPIHERLRGPDFPTLRNYLRISLCNIHDELAKRADGPALVNALRERA